MSNGDVSLDKPKVLLMVPAGLAAINVYGATINTALNIPINQFGKKIPSLPAIRWDQASEIDCLI